MCNFFSKSHSHIKPVTFNNSNPAPARCRPYAKIPDKPWPSLAISFLQHLCILLDLCLALTNFCSPLHIHFLPRFSPLLPLPAPTVLADGSEQGMGELYSGCDIIGFKTEIPWKRVNKMSGFCKGQNAPE